MILCASDKGTLSWENGRSEWIIRGRFPWSTEGLRGPQPDGGQGSELCLAILNNVYNDRYARWHTQINFDNIFLKATVCPKLFGTPKMYQNGPQMANYCAQMPPHTRLYIHGGPQIQKCPYGCTQGPKFIVFQNARIQTIFEGVKKHTSNSTRLQWDLLIMVKSCFWAK